MVQETSSALSPISITNTHQQYRVDELVIVDLVQRICKAEAATIEDLSIVLSDHPTVLALNRTYLSHDYETDVLSFPLNEAPDSAVVDGEIYVDLDTAYERCSEFGVTFETEAYRYIVHGLLHLLGYTDETPAHKAGMKRKEDFYLAGVTKS